jgi:hypothetical protein
MKQFNLCKSCYLLLKLSFSHFSELLAGSARQVFIGRPAQGCSSGIDITKTPFLAENFSQQFSSQSLGKVSTHKQYL